MRTITYLRVSVTDRCDFRCVYCMSEHMTFLPKADLLSLEELDRLCSAFIAKGVTKLRLTGGEPLVRRGIMTLVSSLSRHLKSGALNELTLTTNGSQLEKYAAELKGYGVERVNVSIDTLDPDKFRAITRWGDLGKVLAGVDAAQKAGLKVKINAVALKGVNEDELADMTAWAHGRGMDLTLIDRGIAPRPVSAAVARARASVRALHAGGHRVSYRWAGPLRARQGDRRPARLHHAAHPQLLRKLQPRAHHLHRHALYVPRAERRRRPARAAARLRERRSGPCRHRRGHRPQAEGPRFHHRPRAPAPRRRPPHERDRRIKSVPRGLSGLLRGRGAMAILCNQFRH